MLIQDATFYLGGLTALKVWKYWHTALSSQLPVKDKYDVIGKETIAGAVMYRITHQAARIELHGESLRKICGKK